MTESEFRALAARGYNRVPLVVETFADLDTPLSVYLKLAAKPNSYLLDIGARRRALRALPRLSACRLGSHRGARPAVYEYRAGAVVHSHETNDPLQFVSIYRSRFQAFLPEGLPRFCGGLVGYFAYDCVRYFEGKLAAVSKPDALDMPDIVLLVSAGARGRR